MDGFLLNWILENIRKNFSFDLVQISLMTTMHEELRAFLSIHTYTHAFIHTRIYVNRAHLQCIYINTYIILDPNYMRSNTLLFF